MKKVIKIAFLGLLIGSFEGAYAFGIENLLKISVDFSPIVEKAVTTVQSIPVKPLVQSIVKNAGSIISTQESKILLGFAVACVGVNAFSRYMAGPKRDQKQQGEGSL